MNFLMKGAKYKNPMNTFQEQRAGMDNMIKSAREFAGTATKEGHSISPFALIMTKEVEYYITIPNEVMQSKDFGMIGSIAKQIHGLASVFVSEGWMAKLTYKSPSPEEKDYIDKIVAGNMAVSDLPENLKFDAITMSVVAYSEALNFTPTENTKLLGFEIKKDVDGKKSLSDVDIIQQAAEEACKEGGLSMNVASFSGNVVEGMMKPEGNDKGFVMVPLPGSFDPRANQSHTEN
jgi:hypothetical protein